MAPRPQNQKRRPESARRANRIIQTRTLLLLGVFGVLTFVLLFTQLYRWQITEHDELQSVAVRQQTLRTTVEASRGTIYDKNGTILAMSASAEDIFISPKEIIENDQDQNLIAGGLAEILDLDPADILKKMEKTNSQYEELKKKADDELADKVREFINENDLKGVFIRPTSKRTYPKGTLASQVIGFTNDLGGAMGLEAAYNDELTGENGMVVTARDRDGRSVLYQYDQYFDAENGCDLHTTLDTTIQYYLEKGVQELEARFGTGKGRRGYRHGRQHRRGAGDGVAADLRLEFPRHGLQRLSDLRHDGGAGPRKHERPSQQAVAQQGHQRHLRAGLHVQNAHARHGA